MGKVIKKAKKIATKSIKAFDPGMDALMGISKGEEQAKQAERMAQIAETQAQQQFANTSEQARAAAQAQQTSAERDRILAEQQQQQAPEAPTVEIAPVGTDPTQRRKKFQAPQLGGGSGGGASIRL